MAAAAYLNKTMRYLSPKRQFRNRFVKSERKDRKHNRIAHNQKTNELNFFLFRVFFSYSKMGPEVFLRFLFA